jgi:hypothetical protein
MELQFPSSLSFTSTTVLCKPDPQEPPDSDKEISVQQAELYAKYVQCKQVNHPNLCNYIEIIKPEKNLMFIISESHNLNLEKIFVSRA